MTKHLLLLALFFCTSIVMAQGESSQLKTNFTHYDAKVNSMHAKWTFDLVVGDPMVIGTVKWDGDGSFSNDDIIILKLAAKKDPKTIAYVQLTCVIKGSGEGYGYANPNAAPWNKFFFFYTKNDLSDFHYLDETTANNFWKNGFEVTDFQIIRL